MVNRVFELQLDTEKIMKNSTHIIYLAFLLTLSAHVFAADCHIIEPKKLLEIMESSELEYRINMLKKDDVTDEIAPKHILVNNSYLEANQGHVVLKQYKVSQSTAKLFKKGDQHFLNKEFNKAIATWDSALKKDPSYYFLYTMIGDAYFSQMNYKEAKYSFIQAINLNPIDYQAHWFLAHTFKRLANHSAALDHIILAHIYNRHHPKVLQTLQGYLQDMGLSWTNWDFIPQYKLDKTEKGVDIRVEMKWLGYALAKALWRFEPGYPEQGKKDDNLLDPCEERQAILMSISHSKEKSVINDVLESGMISSFIHYEIGLRKYPGVARLLPSESIKGITNYVKRFHTSKQKNDD